MKKPKLKPKGKKKYKNTHGKMHRVVPNYRFTHMIKRRKRLRKLQAQLKK